jgi:hypothetical protein
VRRDRRGRRASGLEGIAVVLLTLLVLVMCAGTIIAITHIRSLKTEIAALERELASLKQQAAKPATAEKRIETSRTVETRDHLDARMAEKNSVQPQNIPAPGALILSSEEIRLIRDYIKPAPSAGAGAPAVNVGDPVTGGTIPLPSPLTDKIPKLQGGRFTIRNGSIVIFKRDSQKADAVLPPL